MRYNLKQCAIKKRDARPLNLAHVTTKWVVVCNYAKFRIVAHVQKAGEKKWLRATAHGAQMVQYVFIIW